MTKPGRLPNLGNDLADLVRRVERLERLGGRVTGGISLPPSGDTTAPVISAVSSIPTSTGATIAWTTNEPSNTQVEYGTTTGYGSLTTLDPSLVSNHTVVLAGLASSTLYYYRVRSRDAAGNLAMGTGGTLTTVAAGDVTAPVISAVVATPNTSGATIAWTTNEPSNTQVEYGTSVAYGLSTTLNASLVTSHSASITGLNSSTLYYYRVLSRDASGNLATGSGGTFTTSAAAGAGTNVTTLGIVVNAAYDQRAAIQAMLNARPANSTIYFPAGDYRYGASLFIPGNITINGPGKLIGTNVTDMAIYMNGVDNVTLDGLQVEGVGTARYSERQQTGICAYYGGNIIVKNCTVKYSSSAGIYFEGTDGFSILNNLVQETRSDAIHMTGGARHGIIEGNTVINPNDDCLACVTYGGQTMNQYLVYRNNNVTGGRTRGASCIGGYDITFIGNTIANSGAAGIIVSSEPSYSTEGSQRVLIKDNILNACNTNPAINHGGIFLWGGRLEKPVTDVTIIGNQINNTPVGGAHMVIQGGNVARTNFQNNTTVGTKPHTYIESASNDWNETGGIHNGSGVANHIGNSIPIAYPDPWGSVATPVAPSANFTNNPSSPPVGQLVTFTDMSTGLPTSWLWNFGDSTTSTLQNPTHTYAATGDKTVTLTATNAQGSNGTSHTVTVVAAPAAFSDAFTGTNGAPWDAAKWVTSFIGGNGTIDIQGNQGRMITLGAGSYLGVARAISVNAVPADFELYLEHTLTGTFVEQYSGIYVRADGNWSAGNAVGEAPLNGYGFVPELIASGTQLSFYLTKVVAGIISTISGPVTLASYTVGAPIKMRLQCTGTTIRGRCWQGASEPGTWTVSATDSAHVSGKIQIRITEGGAAVAVSALWDSLTVIAL